MPPFIAFCCHLLASFLHVQLAFRLQSTVTTVTFNRLFILLMYCSGALHFFYATYYGLSIWSISSTYVIILGYSILSFVPGLLSAMFLSDLSLNRPTNNKYLNYIEKLLRHPSKLIVITISLSFILLIPHFYQEVVSGHTRYTFGNLYALAYLFIFLLIWALLYAFGFKPRIESSHPNKPLGYMLVIGVCVVLSFASIWINLGHMWSLIPIISTVGLSLVFCWRRYRAQFIDTLLNQVIGITFVIFALVLHHLLKQASTYQNITAEQSLLLNAIYVLLMVSIFKQVQYLIRGIWLPSDPKLKKLFNSLPDLLSNHDVANGAIKATEQLLSTTFATEIKINASVSFQANFIELPGEPKISAAIKYKHGWLPWFSESTDKVTAALMQLQSHLKTLENLAQKNAHRQNV